MGRSPDRAGSPNRATVKGGTDPRHINFGDLNILGIPRGASPARSRMSRAGSRMPGAPSRAGLSRAGSPRDPYFEVHSPEHIEKERRFERMRLELKRQFEAIDTNRDGFVDKKELIDYMMALTRDRNAGASLSDDEYRSTMDTYQKVCDELFDKLDKNHDGKVSLEEFVEQYHASKRYIIEVLEGLELGIRDMQNRANQIAEKLEEMKRTERTTNQPHPVHRDINIMVGSILSVHVIDARDLVSGSGSLANAQVRLKIEKQSSKTQVVQSTNDPVWNEVIAFDINQGNDSLKLIIEDV